MDLVHELQCMRMVGSGSAAYDQGWDMDAIAACVVGGVFVTPVVLVRSRCYRGCSYLHRVDTLTILGIDATFSLSSPGVIIPAAVTMTALEVHDQKK